MKAEPVDSSTHDWPFLRRYRGPFLDRIVLPVGGIGTGTVGLAGNGALRDWEVMNVPAKGYVPSFRGELKTPTPSLLLRFQEWGRPPGIKVLEGPIPLSGYEAAEGSEVPNANLPRFRRAGFATAYPFGEVELRDSSCPLAVRLQAFNPFVPGDAELSGFPVAFFRCVLTNPGRHPVQASVSFSLPNFIGADGSAFADNAHSGHRDTVGCRQNRNAWRVLDDGAHAGLFLDSAGVDPADLAWGTISLTTPMGSGLSHRTAWADVGWGDMLLDYWDDLLADGSLDPRSAVHDTPMASLCVQRTVPPGRTISIPFLLAWHFPNRVGWRHEGKMGDLRIGNHYATRFVDAWEVAASYWPRAAELEETTLAFVHAFLADDTPKEIQEAALFNLSTIRTQTCFRAADGRFFAWEGIFDRKGSCHGSCNHVWNYEQGLGRFFPELAKSMHRTAFLEAMDERGAMPIRIALPADGTTLNTLAAADGQAGHVVRVFREWIASGDETFLREMWPAVRRAVAFCWIPGGWDADQDGVMEGCQHNTMDVEYYGPNPQMAGWYLAALRAASIMARHAGDGGFAARCESRFVRGRAWVDAHLFNGEYYEQHIVPPPSADAVAAGLRGSLPANPEQPALQLGAGCLIDQLVGDWASRLAGLGPIFQPGQVRKTLRSILKYNRRKAFWDHFNHFRTYALGDEAAVLMASYPRGNRPARPFPYYNEVMTGFEYVVAGHLLLVGREREARRCVRDIRGRYDGRKRNPYDEAECGHHYGRALASWGVHLAWSGFSYDAREQAVGFSREGTHFWICPSGWGTARVVCAQHRVRWEMQVGAGEIRIARLDWRGKVLHATAPQTVKPGMPWKGVFRSSDAGCR